MPIYFLRFVFCFACLCQAIFIISGILFSAPSFSSPISVKLAKQGEMISSDCVACHQEQVADWKKSDHAMAMALPSATTVKADFSNVQIEHYEQRAQFFIENGIYKAKITDAPIDASNAKGKEEILTIKYTFGHYPLQQYLVETRDGNLQVLPFAWDTRPEQEGGQRWYHNYSQDNVTSADRLHWRQPLQNYNGMCADCHSDEIKRHYLPAENTFATSYTGINVGCVSCHGNMPEHQNTIKEETNTHALTQAGVWTLLDDKNTAVWKGELRDNRFMDTCFACHSLRAPMTDGFEAEIPFLDQFSPNLVTSPLYYSDGQIKEEVYVYGSFLQSKMYAAGVNCLDCHDPHTMKLKIQGNGLCLQCHKASEFNVPTHHKHALNSAGAQCVNCHMTDETYMGVDNRRDHSFKMPRPHLSDDYDIPNACTDCHDDQSNQWASEMLSSWFGKPKDLSKNALNLIKLRHGENIGIDAYIAIANDDELSVIDRASAIESLQHANTSINPRLLAPFIDADEALIRLAVARMSSIIPPQQRSNLYAKLLQDPYRSVRVAAAQGLVGLPLSQANMKVFASAFRELSIANENSAWRGEGRVNQGNIALAKNDLFSAELAYKASIDIDPYFAPGYMNLADLYRAKQREDMVAKVLSDGLEKLPQSADIAYANGLHLVRAKKVADSIAYFKRAMQLNQDNPQLAYTYVLALDGNNQSTQALRTLKELIVQYQDKQSLRDLGLYLSQKLNDRESYQWFVNIK